jgi:hypothetical protein
MSKLQNLMGSFKPLAKDNADECAAECYALMLKSMVKAKSKLMAQKTSDVITKQIVLGLLGLKKKQFSYSIAKVTGQGKSLMVTSIEFPGFTLPLRAYDLATDEWLIPGEVWLAGRTSLSDRYEPDMVFGLFKGDGPPPSGMKAFSVDVEE